MEIDIFADVVCPWCYLGERRLELALERFEHRGEVTLRFRSFELDPSSKGESDLSLDELISKKYGIPITQARRQGAMIADLGAEVDLDYHFDTVVPSGSFAAHRLIQFAHTRGLGKELARRIMRGYFAEGVHISRADELGEMATQVGLAGEGALAVLASDDFAEEVRGDEALAQQLGVTGVPFFLFDNKFGVAGAQDTETLASALETVWSKSHPG